MAHVLVVDDDTDIRDTLRLLLETLRASTRPTVALLDLMMPRMDGPALLRIIANDQVLRSRHAYILLTANKALMVPTIDSLPPDFASSLTLLHKPYESDLLLLIVDQVAQKLATRTGAVG